MDNFNIGSIVISLSLFAIYHIITYNAVYSKSKSITLYRNLINSKYWIEKHKSKDDAPTVTLAIQTLRNTILVAIFLGGGTFTSAYTTLNAFNESSDINDKCRRIILSVMLMLSFLFFASVIRAASHLGYQLGLLYKKSLRVEASGNIDSKSQIQLVDIESNKVDDEDDDSGDEIDIVKESNKMASVMVVSFNIGFRFMYIAISFSFYSAGAIALDIATGVMLIFLFLIDRAF